MENKSVKGSQTEKNLMRAFAEESQAYRRYLLYASQANKESLYVIARVFEKSAENEKEHAEAYFNCMEGGIVDFAGGFPAGPVGDTMANLSSAASSEYDEWMNIYPEFAKVAEDEGFTHIAHLFMMISEVEKRHEARFLATLEQYKNGELFTSKSSEEWVCKKCGYIHNGTEAPDVCPICCHDKGHFKAIKK